MSCPTGEMDVPLVLEFMDKEEEEVLQRFGIRLS
jgi:hypothetical protein